MYNIDDKPAAIKEIQGYLRGIGYDSLPVIISGSFDDNTTAAVKDFQEKSGLIPSGSVDYTTFNMLYESYTVENDKRRIREKHESFITFPLSVGKSGAEVEALNDLIIEILDYYGHYHEVRRGSYFSEATEEGVMLIEEMFGFSVTGEVDEITYERMLIERDSIFEFKS